MRAIGVTLILLGLTACHRNADESAPPTRAEIWAAIQPMALRHHLVPGFVFALVAAESNFDPMTRNGEACGLLQLKPGAWQEVSKLPYQPAVWNWRIHLEVGIDYLAHLRATLPPEKAFSYPLLSAAFHYGRDYVAERDFNLRRMPVPDNAIYREIWSGKLEPVPPPR